MHREVRLVFQLLRLNFEPDLECEKKTRERADYFNASQPACYQNLDTKHSCWRCK